MNNGDFFEGDFHTQVASGHHDAVGDMDDFVDVVYAVGVFNFGDQTDVVAAQPVEFMTDFNDIIRRTDKGSSNKVKFVLYREGKIA